MKILFVTDLYPIGNENIAKSLFYFVQEWKKQGHEVEVIRSNFVVNTLLRGRKIVEEKIYFEEGVKVYNLNFQSPFLFDVYKKLPKDFSLKTYDVMISHMPCGALMATKLLKKDNIKYICSCHCSDIQVLTDIKYSLYFKNELKKAYLIADKISPRSPVLKEKIENLVPETKNKTFVAFSGIDSNFITQRKIFENEIVNITTVASFIKRKNIDTIIKAVAHLNDKKIKLNIIGDGCQKKYLKNLSKNINVEFLGKLNRLLVIEQLKKSDIFVLLSDNETFGLSYLEAMATGNIVVAKKNDGIDGILKDKENAFLIDSNEYALKDCLIQILNLSKDDILKIQDNSYKTIVNYTSKIAGENYVSNMK